MWLPGFCRRSQEISVAQLESRLGEANAANLKQFTGELGRTLHDSGVSVGFYVVGGYTYKNFPQVDKPQGFILNVHGIGVPLKTDRKTHTNSDVDLVVGTNQRDLLVPYQDLPADAVVHPQLGAEYDCPLSNAVMSALLSGRMQVPAMSIGFKDWWHGERWANDGYEISAGRPNQVIGFNGSTPIHLAILYYNPVMFRKREDGSDQLIFDEAVSMERRHKKPFCLYKPCAEHLDI